MFLTLSYKAGCFHPKNSWCRHSWRHVFIYMCVMSWRCILGKLSQNHYPGWHAQCCHNEYRSTTATSVILLHVSPKTSRNGTGEANMRHDVHADKHARAASLAHTVGGEGWGGGGLDHTWLPHHKGYLQLVWIDPVFGRSSKWNLDNVYNHVKEKACWKSNHLEAPKQT